MSLPTIFGEEQTFEDIETDEIEGNSIELGGRTQIVLAVSRMSLGTLTSIVVFLEATFDKVQWYRVRSNDDVTADWSLTLTADVNNVSPPEGGVGYLYQVFDANSPLGVVMPYVRLVVQGAGGVGGAGSEIAVRLAACG